MNEINATESVFIDEVITSKKQVNVFLTNGIKLQGIIEFNDDNTITVSGNREGTKQLVYKHAISTIQVVFSK